jgi:hypothetical protein
MKAAVALVVAFASIVAYGAGKPSGGLMFNALADHFIRHFCISNFPGMKPDIVAAFERSRLKFVKVPCRGLKCSDRETTSDLRRLWNDAKRLSHKDALEMCSTYAETLQATEEQYEDELDEFARAADKPQQANRFRTHGAPDSQRAMLVARGS